MGASASPTGLGSRRSPHARMQDLNYFTGSWTASGTVRETPYGRSRPLRTTVSTSSVTGGFWLQTRIQEQSAMENPDHFGARRLWGYDMVSDRYVSFCVDNHGSHTQ